MADDTEKTVDDSTMPEATPDGDTGEDETLGEQIMDVVHKVEDSVAHMFHHDATPAMAGADAGAAAPAAVAPDAAAPDDPGTDTSS